MREYFAFKKPMHRYVLPPYEWEARQYKLLLMDLGLESSGWPTSVPRPVVERDKVVDRQLQVMKFYLNLETTEEIPEQVKKEIKELEKL